MKCLNTIFVFALSISVEALASTEAEHTPRTVANSKLRGGQQPSQPRELGKSCKGNSDCPPNKVCMNGQCAEPTLEPTLPVDEIPAIPEGAMPVPDSQNPIEFATFPPVEVIPGDCGSTGCPPKGGNNYYCSAQSDLTQGQCLKVGQCEVLEDCYLSPGLPEIGELAYCAHECENKQCITVCY